MLARHRAQSWAHDQGWNVKDAYGVVFDGSGRVTPQEPRYGSMMVCDYNGWNDAPEDEREALDLLETVLAQPPKPTLSKGQLNTTAALTVELNARRLAA